MKMAKETTKKETKEVAVGTESSVPATQSSFSLASLQAMAGAGLENVTMNDQSPPWLRALQALSAQLKKSKPEYIEGAKAGMFFNTATQQVFDGEEGLILIPCHFEKRYLEYTAKKEGEQSKFVADHGTNSDVIADLKKEKFSWITAEGNVISEVATYYVLQYDEKTGGVTRAILSMPSSHAGKSRKWMSLITNREIPKLDGTPGTFTPPIFFTAYRATIVAETNGDNDWFTYKMVPYSDLVKVEKGQLVANIKNGDLVLEAAVKFNDLISKGQIEVQQPAEDEHQGESSAAGDAF